MASLTCHYNIFKQKLRIIIQKLSLCQSEWNNEEWKELYPLINEYVLINAVTYYPIVDTIFESSLLKGIKKPCKSIERIEKKMKEQRTGSENYFKVICDFIAITINCNVKEDIEKRIARLVSFVTKRNGVFHIRGVSQENPYGSYMHQNEYMDIIQYVYVYLEEIGYIIEYQIGHPFASYTFKIDSELRDDPKCGKIDLWTFGFYNDVKQYILDKANGVTPSIFKGDIQNKAELIHEGLIPKELQEILDDIYI